MGRIEAGRKITSEPWSPREGQQRNQRRPLFGVEGVLRSKNEKSDKKFQKSARKDLTEPTLLEITDYPVYQALIVDWIYSFSRHSGRFLGFTPRASFLVLRARRGDSAGPAAH